MMIFGWDIGFAGHFGVPRRDFSIDISQYPLGSTVFESTEIDNSLALLGIGALIAAVGGAMYVVVAAGTVFLGKRSGTPDLGKVDPEAFAPAVEAVAGASGEDEDLELAAEKHGVRFEAPGTFFLATVWLAVFIILYAYSWFELGGVNWIIE